MNRSIVFFGTPEFAVASLDALLQYNYTIKAIVTTPDKPAGRGKKITASPVKNYAVKNNLNILQPENLSDENFLNSLKAINADLFIVVAFRKLPSIVWQMPPMGCFNLHASLLPDYRGAAPINRAIINGEKETGLTTFFLNENIDEGKIILSESINIGEDESFGELYNRMKICGASLLIKTVETIFHTDVQTVEQHNLSANALKLNKAPKILKPDCKINWNNKSKAIFNLVRGLNPTPAANTCLISENSAELYLKIFKVKIEITEHKHAVAGVFTDKKTFLKISTIDGFVFLEEIQPAGKNKILITEFLRGYPIDNNWKAI
ncbi:MAG: methionyl-tRNA formyltransferase [Bacteroidetes bacterium]|nr:methionyl-tRNA formyltransferase [Bacteroidota bacterium]